MDTMKLASEGAITHSLWDGVHKLWSSESKDYGMLFAADLKMFNYTRFFVSSPPSEPLSSRTVWRIWKQQLIWIMTKQT